MNNTFVFDMLLEAWTGILSLRDDQRSFSEGWLLTANVTDQGRYTVQATHILDTIEYKNFNMSEIRTISGDTTVVQTPSKKRTEE